MEDLKNSLQNELSHVREVWFDEHGNWYLHNVSSAVRSMTREEILSSGEEIKEEAGEPVKSKKKK